MTYRIIRESDIKGGKVVLDQEIEGPHGLYHLTMNNNIYNVTAENNLIDMSLIAPPSNIVFSLTPGYYDLSTLRTELETQLQLNHPNFTVSINVDQGTFTITNTTVDFDFNYDLHDNKSYKLLGIKRGVKSSSVGMSFTSEFIPYLVTTPIIFIYFRDDRRNNFQAVKHFEASLLISDHSNFQDVIRIDDKNNPTQIIDFKLTRNLSIDFYDIDHNEIEIENTGMILILKKM